MFKDLKIFQKNKKIELNKNDLDSKDTKLLNKKTEKEPIKEEKKNKEKKNYDFKILFNLITTKTTILAISLFSFVSISGFTSYYYYHYIHKNKNYSKELNTLKDELEKIDKELKKNKYELYLLQNIKKEYSLNYLLEYSSGTFGYEIKQTNKEYFQGYAIFTYEYKNLTNKSSDIIVAYILANFNDKKYSIVSYDDTKFVIKEK